MILKATELLHYALVVLSCATSILDAALTRDYEVYPIKYFVKRFRYPFEVHANITTEDGYMLNLYRIPYGRSNKYSYKIRPPVLLIHGLSSSCEDFVVTGLGKGLGFLLAEAGYDVWLGNTRGNIHSRKHMWLDPDKDSRFWEFSFHENGYYDLPAFINYIRNITLQKQIFYVGHSQGCTAFFVMTSTRPEFNKYITLMVGLSPAVYMKNMLHPLFRSFTFSPYGDMIAELWDRKEFVHITPEFETAGRMICNMNNDTVKLCADIIFMAAGNSSLQFDKSLILDLLRYQPAGSSARQFLHYMQEMKSGQFSRFSYNPFQNMQIYGSVAPPTYNLKSVSASVAIYYAKNDILVAAKDVERLYGELPNVVKMRLVNYSQFTHLDFIYAKDVVPLLYEDVIKTMESYR